MRNIFLLFSSILCIQCSADRTIATITEKEIISLETFQQLDNVHKLFITDDAEPGEKLLLCLSFIDKNSKKVIPNQQVSFYHTSTTGEYEPSNSNDETTARLNGKATTDKLGRVYIETILPGDYGSGEGNRHIHTTVFNARPEYYDIFFKDYIGGFGKLMNSGNDQMFFADLKKDKSNKLIGFITIEVKNPKTAE